MVLILPPIERTWADSKAFIVRMEWSQIQSTVRGATADDCAVVFPDRLVHIERRNQQLPSVQASLQVYEFTLTEDQIASLRNILGDPALAGLPSFAPFGLPGSVIVREALFVDVPQDDAVRRFGYEEWQAASPPDAEDSKRQALQNKQSIAKTALQPLLHWFSILVSQPNVSARPAEPNFCSTPSHADGESQ